MRGKELGIVAAFAAVSLTAAACGSSKSGTPAAAAAASSPTAAAATTSAAETPSPSPTTTTFSPLPLSGSILETGLLDPSVYGGSYNHEKGAPHWSDGAYGLVTDIPGSECWKVLDQDGPRIGSVGSARDGLLNSSNDDYIRQGAYQFNAGDAATMVTDILAKAKQCGTYDSTTTDTTYHEKAVAETLSGLGDQAIEITITDNSAKFGPDTSVQVIARYGDVVVSVDFDAVTASRATGYDVVGKVKAIAAKLRLTATGS